MSSCRDRFGSGASWSSIESRRRAITFDTRGGSTTISRIAGAAAAKIAAQRCSGILYGVRRNRSCTARSSRRLTSNVIDGAEQQGLDDMRFASRQLFEPVVRLQCLEDELDLPACRVGLSDGVGVERVRVDVGEVEPISLLSGSRTATRRRRRRAVRRMPPYTRRLNATSTSTSRTSRFNRPATSLSRLPSSSMERPRH